MVESLEQTVIRFLHTELRLSKDDSILLAVSGGADSVALLHIMHRLAETGQLQCSLVVAHVNHNLRCDAALDQKFVQGQARQYEWPFLHRSIDVRGNSLKHKLSVETAARQLRLNALVEMARQADCSIVSTGHHADDNVETLLHRMLRGTGFRGLGGIELSKQFHAYPEITFIRPLLSIKREQILAYCRTKNVSWREDFTNQQITFTRNRIRHSLIPMLCQEFGPGILNGISTLSNHCRSLQQRIEHETDHTWPHIVITIESNKICLSRVDFVLLPLPIQVEIIHRALTILDIGLREITQKHYLAMLSMIQHPRGKMEVPGHCGVTCSDSILIFEKTPFQTVFNEFQSVTLSIPGITIFGTWEIEATLLKRNGVDLDHFIKCKDSFVEWLDAESLCGSLAVRNRTSGDRFCPLGLSGDKKIGKFLASGGITLTERKKAFVIIDARGIVWVAPFRIDQRCRVKPYTKTILQLQIKPSSST
ncbi:MAG: tRNA lysidine(34) synthetase TilS [Sedimentisphaerales bacterium]|nr:tRNA lysidine(34) synthetase TilS [Sedimentisphaerales bacterium]